MDLWTSLKFIKVILTILIRNILRVKTISNGLLLLKQAILTFLHNETVHVIERKPEETSPHVSEYSRTPVVSEIPIRRVKQSDGSQPPRTNNPGEAIWK